jgi:lipid II:glycine glycyltransferase (peptidoglycan interpeptide bridge formation enzyme)
LIMPYDPSQPYLSGMQYVNVDDYLSPELHARVEKDVKTICTALGYDLNTVEFAIKDGIPYAIDFMNPAPDAELASVGETNHRWIVDTMTDFIFKKLEEGFETPEYRWSSMLNPAEKTAPKAKTVKAKKTETKTTKTKKAGNAE